MKHSSRVPGLCVISFACFCQFAYHVICLTNWTLPYYSVWPHTHPAFVQRFCRMSLLPFYWDVCASRSERWNINYHLKSFLYWILSSREPPSGTHFVWVRGDWSIGMDLISTMHTKITKQFIPGVGQNNFLACTGSWSGFTFLHCHQIADIG